MKPLFSFVGSGLITLGLVAGLSAPSLAGPIPKPELSVPVNAMAPDIVPVRDGWAGDSSRQMWRFRNGGGRNWNGGNWHGGNWNGGRHWRYNHGGYHGGGYYGGYDDNGAAALLGLGLGFGLGSLYQGYYNNGYYNGYYAPRRYYSSASSAHVRWCYNRYRSYRAWDNTFQPYNGQRQQCYSPY
jgi:hypothetical protein